MREKAHKLPATQDALRELPLLYYVSVPQQTQKGGPINPIW